MIGHSIRVHPTQFLQKRNVPISSANSISLHLLLCVCNSSHATLSRFSYFMFETFSDTW